MNWQYCVGFSTAIVIPNEGGVKWGFFQGDERVPSQVLKPHPQKKTSKHFSQKNEKLIISWRDEQIIQSYTCIIEYEQNLFLHFSYKITKDIPDSHAAQYLILNMSKTSNS